VTTLDDLSGSHDVISHVTIRFVINAIFYCGHLQASVYLQQFSRYWDLRVLGVITLTFQGHATSSVTWPFDFPQAI